MTNQTYGQYCGLARAIEVVGEPWAMLMIRDLLVGPKSFLELRQGNRQMPAGVLSARLEELEGAGVIRRRTPSASMESTVFELTEYGAELDEVIAGLMRWGMRTMGGLRRDEEITPDSMVFGLRVAFRPEAARGLRMRFVVELGDIILHTIVDDGHVETGKGPIPDPDLIIEAGPALKFLISGEMSPKEALETGAVRLRTADGRPGDPGLLAWFVEFYRVLPPPPARLVVDGQVPSMLRPAPSAPLIGEPAVPVGIGN